MTTIRTSNNPVMLVWAREEVGYTLAQAADALGISVELLKAAESGEHCLTLSQLRTAAERYEIPFGYFYLSKPPYEKSYEPVPDFRVEPGLIGIDHYRLKFEIKRARDWRLEYIDLASILNYEFSRFRTIPNKVKGERHNYVRDRLGVKNHEIEGLTYDDVYGYWKGKIEKDGVLVYESQYIPDESGVIGAAIFYDQFPIILIKRGGLANSRKLFTLLHEYAHLLNGESAINDAGSLTISQGDNNHIEVVCNRLAADILVPPEKIIPAEYDELSPVEKMESLAARFKVTYSTAAVCLRRFNLISYGELGKLLEFRRNENAKKKDANKNKEVKIPRENIMRLDMGRPMFDAVITAYSRGVIDIYDASKILNLRVKKIDKLVSGAVR